MVKSEFVWQHNRNMRDAADRLNELQKEVDNSLEEAAEEIGLRVIADSTRLVHVDTGRLRSSLSSETKEVGRYAVKVVMGSNVEYADDQERMYPYLRPAIRKNEDKIEEIAGKAIQQAVKEVS